MCEDYVWYIINQHHGWGVMSFGHSVPQDFFNLSIPMGVSECSWLIPTWEAFERASV